MRRPGIKNRDDKRLVFGRTASFRPPDEEFVKKFNLAIDATGMSPNKLMIAAIRQGLHPVVASAIHERKKYLAEFQKLMSKAEDKSR